MEITPEKYVELYKKLSPRVTDEELIDTVRRRGEFDPEKRVRTLCLDCVKRGDGEESPCFTCKDSKMTFAHLNSYYGVARVRLMRPSKLTSEMDPLEYLEYYELMRSVFPGNKIPDDWLTCWNHNTSECFCSKMTDKSKNSGFCSGSDTGVQDRKLKEGRAIRERTSLAQNITATINEIIADAKSSKNLTTATETKEIKTMATDIGSAAMPVPTAKHERAMKIADTLEGIADDTREASMRMLSSQLVKLTREPLVALLTRNLGLEDNESSHAKVAMFLKSPLGDAMVSGMLSMGVASLPVKNDIKQLVSRELRLRAMGTAMDEAVDLLMEPFRTVTGQLLSGEASLGLLDSGEKKTLNLEAKTEEKVEVS